MSTSGCLTRAMSMGSLEINMVGITSDWENVVLSITPLNSGFSGILREQNQPKKHKTFIKTFMVTAPPPPLAPLPEPRRGRFVCSLIDKKILLHRQSLDMNKQALIGSLTLEESAAQ